MPCKQAQEDLFDPQPAGKVEIAAAYREFLGSLDGEWRVGGEAAREVARGVHELLGRHHAIHEAPAQGELRIDAVAEQQQFHGERVRQLLRHALRAAVGRKHAALDLREREGRVLGGDADVGGQQQRRAAAEAVAVDRGDDRLPHLEAAVQQLALLREHELGERSRRADEGLEIGAGGERLVAGAGHDRHADLGVVAHAAPRVREAGVVLGVHRVHALRTVDGDGRDVIRDVDVDGHGVLLRGRVPRLGR